MPFEEPLGVAVIHAARPVLQRGWSQGWKGAAGRWRFHLIAGGDHIAHLFVLRRNAEDSVEVGQLLPDPGRRPDAAAAPLRIGNPRTALLAGANDPGLGALLHVFSGGAESRAVTTKSSQPLPAPAIQKPLGAEEGGKAGSWPPLPPR